MDAQQSCGLGVRSETKPRFSEQQGLQTLQEFAHAYKSALSAFPEKTEIGNPTGCAVEWYCFVMLDEIKSHDVEDGYEVFQYYITFALIFDRDTGRLYPNLTLDHFAVQYGVSETSTLGIGDMSTIESQISQTLKEWGAKDGVSDKAVPMLQAVRGLREKTQDTIVDWSRGTKRS